MGSVEKTIVCELQNVDPFPPLPTTNHESVSLRVNRFRHHPETHFPGEVVRSSPVERG